jgi:hypothetical protein
MNGLCGYSPLECGSSTCLSNCNATAECGQVRVNFHWRMSFLTDLQSVCSARLSSLPPECLLFLFWILWNHRCKFTIKVPLGFVDSCLLVIQILILNRTFAVQQMTPPVTRLAKRDTAPVVRQIRLRVPVEVAFLEERLGTMSLGISHNALTCRLGLTESEVQYSHLR